MPKPKIWDDSDALIRDLKGYWRRQSQQSVKVSTEWEEGIRRAVAGNTFRAFRKMPRPPSRVFREWARESLVTRGFFEELNTISSQKEFDKWLRRLVGGFRRYWLREMGCEIPFGPSYKLPNLLMKTVCNKLPSRQRMAVVGFLHVALDSYTLVGLRDCIRLPNGRKIPTTATMRFVTDEKVYEDLQQKIRALAKRARVPAIA